MFGKGLLPPDRWQRLRALLDEAMTLAPAQREAWLQGLDVADADLHTRLQALLAQAQDGSAAAALHTDLPQVETGDCAPGLAAGVPPSVGPYVLLRALGQGGMASVWLAERRDMLQARQVALKLPHGSWVRSGLAERMQREREILAALDHPHIARLYDAGVSDQGLPWLALELVQGERIDLHCQRAALDVPARLRLFLQAAHAVAHAHARLVVHRDIKPANMLVDGAGQLKLLDFGIAKLLDQGVAAATELTQQAGRALTPAYASPEQLRGQPLGTATDVYSLGVVLHELLTGVRPFQAIDGDRQALEQAVLHEAPRRPSLQVTDSARQRALRGDLDTIVLKCLKVSPTERYATVAQLADDIERHLQQRPVLARPDSAGYRLRRFVQRNRLAVAGSATVVVALLGGTAVALWQADQARQAQARSDAVKGFVSRLLTDTDPYETASTEPTVRALLDAALQRLPPAQPGNAALRVELLNLIGGSLAGLSEFDRADPVVASAIAEGTRELGADHDLTLAARLLQTSVDRFKGRTPQMQATLDELLPKLRAAPARNPQLLRDALTLGAHLAMDQGRYAQAKALATEGLAITRPALGPLHRQRIGLGLILTQIEMNAGDPEKALAAAAQSRALSLQLYGTQPHAAVLDARLIYGRALIGVGRWHDAVVELTDLLQQALSLLGPQAALPGFVAGHLARAELSSGQALAALQHAELSRDILGASMAPDSFTMAAAQLYVGLAQLALMQGAQAQHSLAQAAAGLRTARGGDSHPQVRDVLALQALALAQQGRLAQAQALLAPLVDRYRQTAPPHNYRGLHVAGLLHRLQGQADQAEALQAEVLATLPAKSTQAPRRDAVLAEQARLALDRGQAPAALGLLDQLAQPVSAAPAPSGDTAERQLTRGRCLLALGRADDALPYLQAALQFWQQHPALPRWQGEASHWLAQAWLALGQAGQADGARADARRWLRDSPFPGDALLVQAGRIPR